MSRALVFPVVGLRETEDEALENIQDAIREYLEAAVKISKGPKVREVEVPV